MSKLNADRIKLHSTDPTGTIAALGCLIPAAFVCASIAIAGWGVVKVGSHAVKAASSLSPFRVCPTSAHALKNPPHAQPS